MPIHPQNLVTFVYDKYLRAFELSTPAAENVPSSDSQSTTSLLTFLGSSLKVINQWDLPWPLYLKFQPSNPDNSSLLSAVFLPPEPVSTTPYFS